MQELLSIPVTVDRIIAKAHELEATDIHLEMGKDIYIRGKKGLLPLGCYCEQSVIDDILQRCHVVNHDWYSVDEAFTSHDIRVRTHLYRANQTICGTLRLLCHKDLSLDNSSEGQLMKDICHYNDGLVLITGPTGSGKSFALACCLEHINRTMNKHIITLEDPIEYTFTSQQSLIHQRQLGSDIKSMAHGIRDALREDPDVIMVGELRDQETLKAALHAAETGHLVLATMHTQRAVMAIQRMISIFPGEQQEEVRSQISQVLRVVICQRLLRWNGHFVTIRDILVNTHAVANLIRNKKEAQIISIQETQQPMKTLEMSVQTIKDNYKGETKLYDLLDQQLV